MCTFLKWAAEPEHDQRKEMALKVCGMFSEIMTAVFYMHIHTYPSCDFVTGPFHLLDSDVDYLLHQATQVVDIKE